MFYVKKDKDEDQVHIVEHDQLSFSSITDQAASVKEEQKQSEPFVAAQVSAYAEDSASHWAWLWAAAPGQHEGQVQLCPFIQEYKSRGDVILRNIYCLRYF